METDGSHSSVLLMKYTLNGPPSSKRGQCPTPGQLGFKPKPDCAAEAIYPATLWRLFLSERQAVQPEGR